MFSNEQAAQQQQPFVSVVIPCYNSMRTLPDCLRSLMEQDFPQDRYEVIVADNGSSDGSPEFIRQSFPKVICVRADQKGSGYARNAGIAAARGELILSTDADCVIDSQWISRLVDTFAKAPENTAAVGGRIVPYSQRTLVERFRNAWVGQPLANGQSNPKVRFTATPNAAFRSSALRKVGGFDGTLGFDDTDLGIRLESAGYGIVYTDAAIVRHRNPVTLRELYRHRFKYGTFGFTLARKHPQLLGDPRGSKKRIRLLGETLWRIAKDLVKLPLSLFSSSRKGPVGWPVIDAVMAWANYMGFRSASLQAGAAGAA